MEFLPISVGGHGLVFPEETSAAAPFVFQRPVRRVRCMLSGFECRFANGDYHLSEVSIRPVVEFDDQASPTTGLVRVELTWRDKGAGIHSAHAAGFFVRLLVVGFE